MPTKVFLGDEKDELASAQDFFNYETVATLKNPVLFAKKGEDRVPYALQDAVSIVRRNIGGPLTRQSLAMEDIDPIEVIGSCSSNQYAENYKTTLNRLLVYNCESGTARRVRSLLAAKASTEAMHPESLKLPLQLAMMRPGLSIFYALLAAGADLTKKNGFGKTAFDIAVAGGHIQLARRIRLIVGSHALSRDAMAVAVANCDLEMVTMLVEEMKFPTEAGLRTAVERGDLAIVEYLVSRAKADVRARSRGDGRSAVVVAAAFGHVEILRFLCAECHAFDTEALFAAAQHDRPDALVYLLSVASASEYNIQKDGMSLICHALHNGAYRAMEALARMKQVDTTDALYYAVEHNRHELVRILMPGAKRVEDNHGPMQDTLLTWAIDSGSYDCISVIVKLRSHLLLQRRPSDGKTPKILAYESCDPDCIRNLERASRKTSFPTARLRQHAASLFAQAPCVE